MFFSMQIFHTWEENADSLTSCEIPRGDLEGYSVAVELKVKSFRKDGDTMF